MVIDTKYILQFRFNLLQPSVVPTQQRVRQVNTRVPGQSWEYYKQVGETTGSQLRSKRQSNEVEELLPIDKTIFSDDSGTLGQTTLVQHVISTWSHRPVKQALEADTDSSTTGSPGGSRRYVEKGDH